MLKRFRSCLSTTILDNVLTHVALAQRRERGGPHYDTIYWPHAHSAPTSPARRNSQYPYHLEASLRTHIFRWSHYRLSQIVMKRLLYPYQALVKDQGKIFLSQAGCLPAAACFNIIFFITCPIDNVYLFTWQLTRSWAISQNDGRFVSIPERDSTHGMKFERGDGRSLRKKNVGKDNIRRFCDLPWNTTDPAEPGWMSLLLTSPPLLGHSPRSTKALITRCTHIKPTVSIQAWTWRNMRPDKTGSLVLSSDSTIRGKHQIEHWREVNVL